MRPRTPRWCLAASAALGCTPSPPSSNPSHIEAPLTRGSLRLSLRSPQGTDSLRLSCRWVEGGALGCDEVSGWPVREGFVAPAAVTFSRSR